MTQRPQTAVYNCIIPFEELLAASDHSSDGTRRLPYPAYPEIKEKNRPLCLPTIMRAVYFLYRSVRLEPEEAITITDEYLSQQEGNEREISQRALALAKSIHLFWQQAALGVFSKDTPAPIDILRQMGASSADRVYETYQQGSIYGNRDNFIGAGEAFSYAHESAHRLAKLSYSGIVLDDLAKQAHKTLETLATKRLRRDRIGKLWTQFWQTNDQIIYLVKKFESMEEFFATYVGLRLLPPEVKREIETALEDALKARNWHRAYKAFAETCDNSQISHTGTAYTILEHVCRLLEHIDIYSADLPDPFWEIFKIMTFAANRTQDSNINEDESTIAVKEDANKINGILQELGISKDLFWSTFYQIDDSVMSRLGEAIFNNFSLSNAEQALLFAPVVTLIGRPSWQEITPYIFNFSSQQNQEDIISPHLRIFYESLRQQLSERCGLVCPFAFGHKGFP